MSAEIKMVNKKNVLKSKTFWFQVLTVASFGLGVVPATTPIIIATAAINAVLRVISKDEITVLPQ